jgi:23S rRNA (guanine745-N1)-methyltransferase
MSIDSTWLRCPNCLLPLSSVEEGVLGCDGGHRYDISRHGTVTLLPPRAPKTIGDTREMLEARRDLLDSGLFAPIAESIVAASIVATSIEGVSIAGVPGVGDTLRIADLGCGTGYYAGRLAQALPSASFLVADRSPVAVRMATRTIPGSTGVVLDLWRPLPLRDATADIAINVFAPRNPSEFARVIRRGGILIVVVPTTGHLSELRTSGSLLDIPAGKDARVTAQLVSAGFSALSAERVEYHTSIDAAQRAELIGMGPSAHHAAVSPEGSASGAASPIELVTVSVDVLAFRRDAED